MKMPVKGIHSVDLIQVSADGVRHANDQVAREEPLEIRISSEPLMITMRTPGNDHELVAGLLLAEGIVKTQSDISSIVHCGRIDDEAYGNTIDVTPAAGSVWAIDEDHYSKRRQTLTTSACGVCGRRSIDDLLTTVSALSDEICIAHTLIAELTEALRQEQPNFALTGGLHAAGIANSGGALLVVREDVGRHNAVDKAVGRLFLDQRLAEAQILIVSGRPSFEIVQKAVRARIPIVIGVSAPSSLAIATASALGVTLIGFSRRGAFNLYTHPERLNLSLGVSTTV